jgi:hypothetical protein
MPQKFIKAKLIELVSSEKWNRHIGHGFGYSGIADIITEVLGVGDARSISFWIGKQKRSWRTETREKAIVNRNGQFQYMKYYEVKVPCYEWELGYLERHGFVERVENEDGSRTFRIHKGLQQTTLEEVKNQ